MYKYSQLEQEQLYIRARQFGQQLERFQAGEIHPDIFQQLRLRNGLYQERHAPMLRVAIPYGELASNQLRALADVARRFDKSYGHFTTRQNIQFNWPKMEQVPEILENLAAVEMHAIQTSGSCIRNISSDHLAGVAADEIEDPRPWCELIRQWSTLHPEFNWLPRKFKFAVTGSVEDRALVKLHDIGLQLYQDTSGNSQFRVFVGGGMGRTPVIGKEIHDALPGDQLLSYLQAILRVYNLHGRRDHKYKSRIKILVNDLGIDQFRSKVEAEFAAIDPCLFGNSLQYLDTLKKSFTPVQPAPSIHGSIELAVNQPEYAEWVSSNVLEHREPLLRNVMISLKTADQAPGDMTAEQMDFLAGLADRYNGGEIRVSHEQNLLLPSVHQEHLFDLWQALKGQRLARANIGGVTDMICCPGMDYCSLANADTIPVAAELNQKLDSFLSDKNIGPVKLKMSGCMNACGHHHVGDIGILGVDKKGEHWYQITLGGRGGLDAQLGARLGPAIHRSKIVDALGVLIQTYIDLRHDGETFNQAVSRLGTEPFKQNIYQPDATSRQAA